MASLAHSNAAGGASDAAAATAAGNCSSSGSRPAASHVSARAASNRHSASAQRCFTAWNWPMGRPNWTRSEAWAAAVCTHHDATPMPSAARTNATVCSTAPGGASKRRSVGTASGSSVTRAGRRVGSAPGSGSTRTWSRSTRTHSPDAGAAARAGTRNHSARPPPSTGSDGSTIAAAGAPASNGATRWGANRPSTVATTAVPGNGPGATARPHSSTTVHRSPSVAALSAGRLRHGQSDPTHPGQLVPERGQHLGRRPPARPAPPPTANGPPASDGPRWPVRCRPGPARTGPSVRSWAASRDGHLSVAGVMGGSPTAGDGGTTPRRCRG